MDQQHDSKLSMALGKKRELSDNANSIPRLRLPTFMDFADDFLLALERDGKSRLTIQSYRYHLKWFWHFLVDNSLTQDVGSIKESDVSKYIVHRRRAGAQNSTLSVLVSALRAFFLWCLQQDFADVNPLAKIRKPKPDRKTMQIFSPEQVAAMIEAWPARTTKGERNRSILLLLYDTGLRVGELVALQLQDVDLKLREILVANGKGRKQRIVGMSDRLRGQLYRWVSQFKDVWGKDSAYLFTNTVGHQLTSRDAWVMVRASGKKAGIEGVRCSPHTFRHSAASGLIADGLALSDLQMLLGHENISTTAVYLHPHPKAVAERHKTHALGDRLKVRLR